MPQTMQLLALAVLAILAGTAHAQEARMVPVTIDGERVRLEMRVYEPTTRAPAPTLVFNQARPAAARIRRRSRLPGGGPILRRAWLGGRDSGPAGARRL